MLPSILKGNRVTMLWQHLSIVRKYFDEEQWLLEGFNTKSGARVVVKVIHIDGEKTKPLEKEIRLLSTLESPYVAKYLGSYLVNKYELWVVREYLAGKSIASLVCNVKI